VRSCELELPPKCMIRPACRRTCPVANWTGQLSSQTSAVHRGGGLLRALGSGNADGVSVQTVGCPGSRQREKGLAKERMGFTSVRVMMTLRPRPRLDSGCRRPPLLALAPVGLNSDHDRRRGRC
jgi:hypothetical protein